MLLQIVERLRRLRQCLLGELRQRVHEMLRKFRVDPVADPGVAYQVDQADVLVDGRSAEETVLDLAPVVAPLALVENLTAVVEGGAQALGREGNVAATDQTEVHAGALGSDEPPGCDGVGRPVGLDAAAAGEVLAPALELDPQVADRLGVVTPAEHPRLEDPRLLAGRVDLPLPGGQQERQQHVHRRRLARAVHAAQQQPPAAEVQHLVLVLVDVDDPGPVQPPPLGRLPGRVRRFARSLDDHRRDGTRRVRHR